MSIASIAQQNQTSFTSLKYSSVSNADSSNSSSSTASSSISVTSNNSTTLQQEVNQIQAEISQLQGNSGSGGQVRKLETELHQIQKKLAESGVKQSASSAEQAKVTEQVKTGEQQKSNALITANDVTPAIATAVGTQLDVYA